MGHQISEYTNVQAKAESLGCNVPTGIAILPRNFASAQTKSELYYESVAFEFRELFQKNGIRETPLEREGDRFLNLLQEGELTVSILPTLFVTTAFVSQNPHLVSLALDVISTYLTDWFKSIHGSTQQPSDNVELSIVVETKSGDCKRVKYNGPIAGLDNVQAVVRDLTEFDQ
jgi:hypothetical protein